MGYNDRERGKPDRLRRKGYDITLDEVLEEAGGESIGRPHMAAVLLRKGGFLLADNTLWDGHVVDETYSSDHQTRGISLFNEHVAADTRAEQVILPLRDGLTIIRKKRA